MGFVWESNSLIENLIRANIFKNLIPELVEKKEPPIITKIKKIKTKFGCWDSKEKPILDILVEIDNKLFVKSVLELKNRKIEKFHTSKSLEQAYLTDMLQEMIDCGTILNPVILNDLWFEIDTTEDLRKAEKLLKI